jgi:hypothetical protein
MSIIPSDLGYRVKSLVLSSHPQILKECIQTSAHCIMHVCAIWLVLDCSKI